MTNGEFTAFCAKIMGWVWVKGDFSGWESSPGQFVANKRTFHPASSLDDIHKVELRVCGLGLRGPYGVELRKLKIARSIGNVSHGSIAIIATATVEQRRAALEAIKDEINKALEGEREQVTKPPEAAEAAEDRQRHDGQV